MLYFKFDFPFQSLLALPQQPAKHFVVIDKRVSENKTFEFQFSRGVDASPFSFELTLELFGRDHAGPDLLLTVLGFTLMVGLHDRRHWNHQARRWMTDDEMERALNPDPSVTLH